MPGQSRKPRVLFIIDYPDWAYDISARSIAAHLGAEFDFDFFYVHSYLSGVKQNADEPNTYDLVFQFFWGEETYRKFSIDPERLLKEVASHRWEDDPAYGPCVTADVLAHTYLGDAAAVCCTSSRLHRLISPFHPDVRYTPDGYDPTRFFPCQSRTGEMTVGWAGKPTDLVKGLDDIIKPACDGRFHLKLADGALGHSAMNEFYNSLDVLVVASKHEGQPLPLIEAMAAGCFPVSTDVGIADELIQTPHNGILLPDRSAQSLADALAWCEKNLAHVRAAGLANSERVRSRTWSARCDAFRAVMKDVLHRAEQPRLRNDDVSADTDLPRFIEFCDLFHRYGYTQLHGITIYGATVPKNYSNDPADLEGTEYPGYPTTSQMDNATIQHLSKSHDVRQRPDLIDFLRLSRDQIALHGLYHYDYSTMTAAAQKADISEGIRILKEMFPGKHCKYFIPPFNRANDHTYRVCAAMGLTVLDDNGPHLEHHLAKARLEPGVWHRYHHHRFYPASAFRHFKLSMKALEDCLHRNRSHARHDDARPDMSAQEKQ